MLSCHFCGIGVCAKSAADTRNLVGNDRNTNTGCTDDDSLFTFTLCNCFCCSASKLRIITGFQTVAAEIMSRIAICLQISDHLLFQFVSTVVTCQCYHFSSSHFCARFLRMPSLCQVRADTNLEIEKFYFSIFLLIPVLHDDLPPLAAGS